MKKNILILLVFISQMNFAQNVFPTSGNVGIGGINPSVPLDVFGTVKIQSSNAFYNENLRLLPSITNDYSSIALGAVNGDSGSGIGQWTFIRYPAANNYMFSLRYNSTDFFNILNNGNVGIGTSNPVTKLDVRGNISVSGENSGNQEEHGQIIFENFNHGVRRIGNIVDVFTSGGPESGITFTHRSYNSSTGSYSIMNTAMKIDSNGNVGIGTNSPSSKLSVLGSLSKLTLTGIDGVFDNLIKYGHKSDLESGTSNVNRWHGIDATITAGNASDNKLKFRLYAGSFANLEPSDVMTLVGNGNVGIGISSPTNKLDVNGTIHSKEVKVDMNGWSDFVFKKEYTLPRLEEVEKHIKEKGHLKNIPSEEEVLKNGINLGEMNAKLLQKIEELTLYVIGQNKKIEELERENSAFKSISERLSKIEQQLK